MRPITRYYECNGKTYRTIDALYRDGCFESEYAIFMQRKNGSSCLKRAGFSRKIYTGSMRVREIDFLCKHGYQIQMHEKHGISKYQQNIMNKRDVKLFNAMSLEEQLEYLKMRTHFNRRITCSYLYNSFDFDWSEIVVWYREHRGITKFDFNRVVDNDSKSSPTLADYGIKLLD